MACHVPPVTLMWSCGSYGCRCGLGTKSSDIDVVLVGVEEPAPGMGFYSKGERPRVRPGRRMESR